MPGPARFLVWPHQCHLRMKPLSLGREEQEGGSYSPQLGPRAFSAAVTYRVGIRLRRFGASCKDFTLSHTSLHTTCHAAYCTSAHNFSSCSLSAPPLLLKTPDFTGSSGSLLHPTHIFYASYNAINPDVTYRVVKTRLHITKRALTLPGNLVKNPAFALCNVPTLP
jgi:hypothetical protein